MIESNFFTAIKPVRCLDAKRSTTRRICILNYFCYPYYSRLADNQMLAEVSLQALTHDVLEVAFSVTVYLVHELKGLEGLHFGTLAWQIRVTAVERVLHHELGYGLQTLVFLLLNPG